MARRSTLERGPQPAVHGGGTTATAAPDGAASKAPGGSAGWRGAGGRWGVWAGRAILWAVLIVVAVNGVRAIFVRATKAPGPASTSGQQPTPASRFPANLAEAFTLQFGQVYLNFDQAHASQRAQQLAAFIPSGAGQQFGWNGTGRMQLGSEQVAGITVQDADNALVKLLVTVNGQLMQFSVPVYTASGGMVVSGEPALLPPPARVDPPSPPAGGSSDLTTQNEFENFLPSFLQAYAASDTATLGRYITPGYSITGLGGVVSYNSIQSLTVPQGGSKRDITVTVRWQLPSQGGTAPATLDVTYEMTWINQSGTWSVETITGSTQQPGQT
jgi:Conjugative transposon protein TcpC